ncbi:MAG: PSD1 and planctomycete cytochrome C domain-containing protein [Fuerstiella sp.]
MSQSIQRSGFNRFRFSGPLAVTTACLLPLLFAARGFADDEWAQENGPTETVVAAQLKVQKDSDARLPAADQIEFFERSVRPLFVQHCYECHSVDAKKLQAGLLMDSRAGLLRGGDSGESIVPGDADASLMIESVRYDSYEMPPKGKLPDKDIKILERWVTMGAPWPKEDVPRSETSRPQFDLMQRKSEHWVWQPIQSPNIPEVVDAAWPKNPLDNFVLAKLEAANLEPAGNADSAALMRRLYFDLIGMPPTIQQADSFLNDTSENAIEKLVDQLLESPHFGERWGRHWLDLVRYAESRGHEFDNDAPNAFQYRDYIIRALNADVPYNQLVAEHLAGDLLPSPRLNPEDGYNESVLGTGFWFLGEWVHSPVDIRKDEADRFDNMIDVMSKTFLGVTVSCARCHDHKFDAISTADYYSMSGFLQSSDFRQVRFESLEHNRKIAEQLKALDEKFQAKIQQVISTRQPQGSGSQSIQMPPLDSELLPFVMVNYATLPAEMFLQDGFLFGNQPRHPGQAFLQMVKQQPVVRFADRSAAVSDSFWRGLKSIHENKIQNRSVLFPLPRSGRTLRTPTFKVTTGKVACRVSGKGHIVACVDSHRMIAGPLHKETVRPISAKDTWTKLNLARYVGHRVHLEFTPAEDSELQVMMVTDGATAEVRQQLDKREQAIQTEVAERTKKAAATASKQLQKIAKAWSEERSKLKSQVMLRSQLAMAMMDGTGEDDRVLIRGNSSKPGDIEPRHFLTAIAGNQPMPIHIGSGRLALANQINDVQNPLASRVIVNRIWHLLMGRGIVPTTDDFGVLGQKPTHPLLLDHLATQFLTDGRSIKSMIRTIVLSRTYQMNSFADPAAVAADPKNLLWHHRTVKRLEGEVVRDALLRISGRLDPTQFGPPVPIHLTSFMDGRGRPKKSGPLDGAGRRSIYIAVRRNFLSPFMLTFDTPAPFSTMGRRNVSNVPAQSLILMNDPLVVDLAASWAAESIQQSDSVDDRIRNMYRMAFARSATDIERQMGQKFVKSQTSEPGGDINDPQVWSDFAHALINTKEFIFLK